MEIGVFSTRMTGPALIPVLSPAATAALVDYHRFAGGVVLDAAGRVVDTFDEAELMSFVHE
jgi:hypothetical protein